METQKIEMVKIAEGTYKTIEQRPFTDGSGTWECTNIVYETPELANEVARKKRDEWGSNLVLLGNQTEIIDGKTYYYPTYNVFD